MGGLLFCFYPVTHGANMNDLSRISSAYRVERSSQKFETNAKVEDYDSNATRPVDGPAGFIEHRRSPCVYDLFPFHHFTHSFAFF